MQRTKNTSIRKVAEQFMVTKRTVHPLVKQFRETGNLEPKKPDTKTPSVLEQHKMAGVEELITETGARAIYLPKYSPDFNPIEML